jgi:hypothetical protein
MNNKLVLPVAIVIALLVALTASFIGIDGLAAIGIEQATAKQVEDGSLRSTMDVDVTEKLGSIANLLFGVLFTIFAWVKGWVHVIAQWVADMTSSKPKARAVLKEDGEPEEYVEELPEDRKGFMEDMLLEAVHARDRRKTILWCHELSGSDYLTAGPKTEKADQPAE